MGCKQPGTYKLVHFPTRSSITQVWRTPGPKQTVLIRRYQNKLIHLPLHTDLDVFSIAVGIIHVRQFLVKFSFCLTASLQASIVDLYRSIMVLSFELTTLITGRIHIGASLLLKSNRCNIWLEYLEVPASNAALAMTNVPEHSNKLTNSIDWHYNGTHQHAPWLAKAVLELLSSASTSSTSTRIVFYLIKRPLR